MKLSKMTTDDVRKQMSIAGSPEKITELMTRIYNDMAKTVDTTNAAELINMKFALRRLLAEVQTWTKQLERNTGQKYS